MKYFILTVMLLASAMPAMGFNAENHSFERVIISAQQSYGNSKYVHLPGQTTIEIFGNELDVAEKLNDVFKNNTKLMYSCELQFKTLDGNKSAFVYDIRNCQ